jgi:hypothetical protein
MLQVFQAGQGRSSGCHQTVACSASTCLNCRTIDIKRRNYQHDHESAIRGLVSGATLRGFDSVRPTELTRNAFQMRGRVVWRRWQAPPRAVMPSLGTTMIRRPSDSCYSPSSRERSPSARRTVAWAGYRTIDVKCVIGGLITMPRSCPFAKNVKQRAECRRFCCRTPYRAGK